MNNALNTFVRHGLAVAIVVLGSILAQSATAATRFWTGGSAVGGNWTLAANWQGNGAPSPRDTPQFVEAGARKTSNTNNYAAGTT